MDEPKILQIIPADDWFALYRIEDPHEGVYTIEEPLVCFALVEEEDRGTKLRYVVGIDAGGNSTDFCHTSSDFFGYRKK